MDVIRAGRKMEQVEAQLIGAQRCEDLDAEICFIDI